MLLKLPTVYPSCQAPCLDTHLRFSLSTRDTLLAKAQFSGRTAPSYRTQRHGLECQAVAAPDVPLDKMQLTKLQSALAQGRKKISVKQLCKEVQLDRADVLQWLKHFESVPPSVRDTVLEARKAAINATEERKSVLMGTRQRDNPIKQVVKDTRERLHYKPGFEPHTPGDAPWASNYGRKKLPRSAEATMERIFDETPRPSEAIVKGLFDLHRLPRRRILDWFAQRRRERGLVSDEAM